MTWEDSYPRTIPARFGYIWLGGLGGEYFQMILVSPATFVTEGET